MSPSPIRPPSFCLFCWSILGDGGRCGWDGGWRKSRWLMCCTTRAEESDGWQPNRTKTPPKVKTRPNSTHPVHGESFILQFITMHVMGFLPHIPISLFHTHHTPKHPPPRSQTQITFSQRIIKRVTSKSTLNSFQRPWFSDLNIHSQTAQPTLHPTFHLARNFIS